MGKVFSVLLFLAFPILAADNPLVGVWKLNTAKSHFSAGHDLPVSLILTIEADGPNGIKYQSKNRLVDGSSGGAGYQAKFDGKDYPVTGTPSYDAVAINRLNANTFIVHFKKGGKIIVDTRYTVAPDGKSLTRVGTATKSPEDVNHFDELFDRQ